MITSSVRAVLYCLRSGATRGTRKSAHCLRFCRTHPGDCPNAERHRTRCPTRHGRNPRILLQRIAAPVAFWNFIFSDILIIKHVPFQIFLLEGKKKDSLSNCCLFRRRYFYYGVDRKSTRLNSSHRSQSRMPSSA